MSTEKKTNESKPTAGKEPYEPPAVISEEVFETLAVTCGKTVTFQCQVSGGFTS